MKTREQMEAERAQGALSEAIAKENLRLTTDKERLAYVAARLMAEANSIPARCLIECKAMLIELGYSHSRLTRMLTLGVPGRRQG